MEVLHAHHRLPRGTPPADDIFAHGGCPLPASSRDPCPGPGPAEEARPPGICWRGCCSGDRGGHRGVEVVRGGNRQWAGDAGPDVLAALGAERGPAEESTYRRAFALVSADVLDRILGAWLHTRAVRAGGAAGDRDRRQDRPRREEQGRESPAPGRGPGARHRRGPGQVAVDEKSNEIPAVRELLKAFADVAGAVFTIDAMHTQTDTAKVILARRADYVMTVKANMPTLYKQLKKLPWAAIPAASSVGKDHGRRARRTIKAHSRWWIGFDGAAQVAQLRRTVT